VVALRHWWRLERRARNARFKLTQWARYRHGARRSRRLRAGFQREIGARQLSTWYVDRHGSLVRSGPFAGLRYPRRSARLVDHLVPKLLGSYELELQPAITSALGAGPSTFVDIGCADGYYAVGVALAAPSTVVHAFDLDAVARRLCRRLARHNRVAGRVSVRGYCRPETLRQLPLENAFVLSDCEGGEVELFSTETVSLLGTTTVLVELHEITGDGHGVHAESKLRARFESTHDVRMFVSGPRDPRAYPELTDLESSAQAIAVDEFRPGTMKWALFTPKPGAPREPLVS
jgi:hypothetical protein